MTFARSGMIGLLDVYDNERVAIEESATTIWPKLSTGADGRLVMGWGRKVP